ncbi:MAG: efflux RND transporter periplasmic adaptor subunit [Xanthobacteraceae bacterium]|nr:efflux RND transporter periplasmic adaptor subunit [Xanthobacteraceae bacterium]
MVQHLAHQPVRIIGALSPRKLFVLAILLALAIGVGSTLVWRGVKPAQALRGEPTAVPVSVASATRKNVPIYLTGLGTVQATYTVGIHSQVDGKLQDVFFKEGQHVKKNEVLAKIDPRLFQAALDQAKARKAQDQATLIGLQKDLDRFKTLGAKGFDTQQNIDQQQAKVDTTRATVAADEAAIETAQTQLDYTDIRAPTDGRMGVRLVDPGNVVHASDQGAIAMLVQTKPAATLFTLPAQTLDAVREAMARATVEAVAYDRDNRNVLSVGTLQTVDNMIDQATATYRLKASFANADEKLWPGEFVNVRILVNTRTDAVVVPNTAIQRGPKGQFVWVVTPQNRATPKPVQTGPSVGDITVVESGISGSDHVVTGGQYKLKTNAPVSVTDKPQPADDEGS